MPAGQDAAFARSLAARFRTAGGVVSATESYYSFDHANAHFVVLDNIHFASSAQGTHQGFMGDLAEVLDTSNLELPYWMLEFGELMGIITGAGHQAEQAEVSILSEAISAVKQRFAKDADDAKRITVDTPVPYRLTDLIQYIDQAMGKLDKAESNAPFQRLKARLTSLQMDTRYAFMFGGVAVRGEDPFPNFSCSGRR